ncbi:MAG: sulfurtransferase, partial [Candidatus Nitrosotenuis sp.]
MTYSWLLEHLDDQNTVIIDTRPKISYSYGHIPNSISLTVEQIIEISSTGAHFAPNPEKASLQLGELGIDNEQIVVVCGDLMDPSVFRVAWTLQYLGQKNTKILNLSIGSWHGMGLNMTRVQKNSPITKFIPNVQNSIRIESEELFQLIDDLIILDARTPQEYFAGHIPRSILFPFTDGIGQDGMLLETKESLENLFVQKQ